MMQYNDNYPTIFIPVDENNVAEMYENGIVDFIKAVAEIASDNSVNIEVSIQRDYFSHRAEHYQSMKISPEARDDEDESEDKEPIVKPSYVDYGNKLLNEAARKDAEKLVIRSVPKEEDVEDVTK